MKELTIQDTQQVSGGLLLIGTTAYAAYAGYNGLNYEETKSFVTKVDGAITAATVFAAAAELDKLSSEYAIGIGICLAKNAISSYYFTGPGATALGYDIGSYIASNS